MSNITLITDKAGEPRADSRYLANRLQNKHKNVVELIDRYAKQFGRFGVVPFKTEKPQGPKGGRPEQYALLNEDQSYFLLSLSRNTDHVVNLKADLVQAFKQARAGQAVADLEYLPGYHQLHDKAHQLAAGSANERFVHMNLNKLVNKTVGLAAGQRQTASAPVKSLTVVAQTVALNAMDGAKDHHDGYERAKTALVALSSALMLKAA